MRIVASTEALSPGASGGTALRGPSQTIGLSRSSSQCEARKTWSLHGSEPAFVTSTVTIAVVPACNAARGGAPQRTARGPFDTAG